MEWDGPVLPVIELGLCDGCGKCVIACPTRALEVRDERVTIVRTDCDYCGECEAACPTGAISCPFYVVAE